ncbi:unnamed protein product [Polarella glacialis]|uniref:Uncharacterized protein n=1 Tax=Polarella glacialis TaxID=89957 RepID=A0A813FAS8_POLGL|nr:unnamed protein product [Polarella glacialis]
MALVSSLKASSEEASAGDQLHESFRRSQSTGVQVLAAKKVRLRRPSLSDALINGTSKFKRSDSFRPKAQVHEAMHTIHENSASEKDNTSLCRMALFYLFGMSAWWAGNVIFAQLPLLVAELPEAESLGSTLSMMIQTGNIVAITYKVVESQSDFINVSSVIQGMNQVSLLVLMLAAIFWDRQVHGHSLPLFVLTAIGGGVGCLSDLTYWSLVISHPPACTKAVGVGMSVGNLVAMVFAVLQQTGRAPDNPRFSIQTFFVAGACVQLLWGVVALAIEDKLLDFAAKSAAAFSPKLSQRLVSWFNPMEDKAKALLRADQTEAALGLEGMDEETAILNDDLTGDLAVGLPSTVVITVFECLNFVIYAATYTMPTLLPLSVGGYALASEKSQLLLRMMFLQSIGEVSGRLLAPTAKSGFWHKKLPFAGGLVLPCCLSVFTVGAVNPSLLPGRLQFSTAMHVLPALVFMFSCSRGMLTTAMFLRARELTASRQAAEHLASTMGFCGQMGALSANIVSFGVVNFFKRTP